jgi:hypothetical protein
VEEIAEYNKPNKSSLTKFDVKEKDYRNLFEKGGIVGLNMFD